MRYQYAALPVDFEDRLFPPPAPSMEHLRCQTPTTGRRTTTVLLLKICRLHRERLREALIDPRHGSNSGFSGLPAMPTKTAVPPTVSGVVVTKNRLLRHS